ncbi:MAG: tetratricopeptide repeat protein [Candidatus Obscuribacterales bacterium]|nr:tetratricopeptide repeat protein [Candidatus Obscuribacterales bacterium]
MNTNRAHKFGIVLLLSVALILCTCQVGNASISIPGMRDGWQSQYSAGLRALEEKRYERAHELLILALDQAVGNEQQIFQTLSALEDLYEEVGDYESQEQILQGRLLLLRNSKTSDPAQIVETLMKLGGVSSDCGDYFEARQYFTAALPLLAKVAGSDSFDVAVLLNNLGWAEQRLKDTKAASTHFLASLKLLKATVGDNSVLYGLTAANLAEVYVSTEEFYPAILWLKKASFALEYRLGADHAMTKALEKRLRQVEREALKRLKRKEPKRTRPNGEGSRTEPEHPANGLNLEIPSPPTDIVYEESFYENSVVREE